MENVRVSLTVRISYSTVYPIKFYVSTCSMVGVEVEKALPLGSRLLMMYSYYGSNAAVKIASERGYIPIVKPT